MGILCECEDHECNNEATHVAKPSNLALCDECKGGH